MATCYCVSRNMMSTLQPYLDAFSVESKIHLFPKTITSPNILLNPSKISNTAIYSEKCYIPPLLSVLQSHLSTTIN